MTEKRYFERKWEGEYYIFDSYTISEKEFDEKVEYEDYQAFEDCMHGDDVINRMNKLNDENKELKAVIEEVFEMITNLDYVRGQYLNALLDVLGEENDVDKTRERIKEFLE